MAAGTAGKADPRRAGHTTIAPGRGPKAETRGDGGEGRPEASGSPDNSPVVEALKPRPGVTATHTFSDPRRAGRPMPRAHANGGKRRWGPKALILGDRPNGGLGGGGRTFPGSRHSSTRGYCCTTASAVLSPAMLRLTVTHPRSFTATDDGGDGGNGRPARRGLLRDNRRQSCRQWKIFLAEEGKMTIFAV